MQSVADELDGFEQLFHQYLLDRKASASTVTWDKIQALPESAVSGVDWRRGEGEGEGGMGCWRVCHSFERKQLC